MKFSLWLLAYVVSLIIQIAVLQPIVGPLAPTLSFAVLLLGVSFQPLWASLWLAGIAGILRDSIAPSFATTYTIFYIMIFLVIHFFKNISYWDEPARTIMNVAVGILAVPVAWLVTGRIGQATFHLSNTLFSWNDVGSVPGRTEIIFTIFWFFCFVWLSIRYFRRHMSSVISHIR